MRESWKGNPLLDFLKAHGLTPSQLAIAAGIDYTLPYAVLNGYLKHLPWQLVDVIDNLDGKGAGDKVAKAYLLYRDGLAHHLLMKA
jgi:hypothetical protein